MVQIQFQVAILALVSLLAIYFADCRSTPWRDLDSSIPVEQVYPEAYEEWVNLFVENQVQIVNKL